MDFQKTTFRWGELSGQEKRQALARPVAKDEKQKTAQIADVFSQVSQNGDKALKQFSQQWDQIAVEDLQVDSNLLQKCLKELPLEKRKALEQARDNIKAFHEAQIPENISLETMPGLVCQQIFRPIERIGVYIPGGTAPLVSTLLMTILPAQIAGVEEILVCTPPSSTGVDEGLLAACALLNIDQVYQVGGAQAIAAMSLGTETISQVQKLFGPGNSWVTLAKQWASQQVPGLSIDMPAGPSEVLVIADKTADPSFVACDLLSQAEHGEDSQCVLLSPSQELIKKVQDILLEKAKKSSRWNYLKSSLESARFFQVDSLEVAIELSNAYAPEHLILQCEAPASLVPKIQNAASIFLGAYTPESLGDYASGTNHVLPTGAYARSCSGLNLRSFLKSMTLQQATPEALLSIAPTVETLAAMEGLPFHGEAVALRRRKLEEVSL